MVTFKVFLELEFAPARLRCGTDYAMYVESLAITHHRRPRSAFGCDTDISNRRTAVRRRAPQSARQVRGRDAM